MIKFNKEEKISEIRGALQLRGDIENIVDGYRDIKNLSYMGVGGTWASSLQTLCHLKEKTKREVYAINASEYISTGDMRIGEGSVIVVSSVSGNTPEIIDAVKKAKENGAGIIGFIDKRESPLAEIVDHCITYSGGEQIKFFITADRFMKNWGEFDEYEEFYSQLDKYLPEGLAGVECDSDEFAKDFACKHYRDNLHYFVGAGNIYGATYSNAMCYWEEQHNIKTKSIHSAEFFHGMLEIIDEDTNITVFIGEDSQRNLSIRVKNFLDKVCRNHTIIDVADYAVPGIEKRYRGNISHLIMRAIANRIDVHIEDISGHNMDERRYYRKIEY